MQASHDEGMNTLQEDLGGASKPRVLIVYYSFTHQARKIAEVMAEGFTEGGCEVEQASIEFTDQRYSKRFSAFPFNRPFLEVVGMLPAEMRRATGEIGVPDQARAGDYDLVVIGSPTWWLSTNVPIRSYLESTDSAGVLDGTRFAGYVVCRRYWKHNLKTVQKLGTERGGQWVDGIHFSYPGGQVRSLMSLISYLGSGENRERYLGVPIPPTNLQPNHLVEARAFADRLAEGVAR